MTETTTPIFKTANNDEAFTRLLDVYGFEAMKVAILRQVYWINKNDLGMDHAETKAAWDVYVDADAKLQPLSVKIGQMSMRRQMDAMSAADYEEFRRNND